MFIFRKAGFELGLKHARELEGITDKETRRAVRKEQILETLSTAAILTAAYAVVALSSWAIAKVVQILF